MKTKSVARKFIVAFSAMFLVPLLIAVYLFFEYTGDSFRDVPRISAIFLFVILLGTAGFLITRSIVLTLLRTSRDAEAIADGDISRRLSTDAESEISELAKNFNRITSRLQQTVDNLQSSRKQMQALAAQLFDTGSRPGDMTATFDEFLNTLLSLTGLEVGAIFLMSSDGKSLKIRVSHGLGAAVKAAVIPAGNGIVGWVASHGQMVTTSESMPWKEGELSDIEKSMTWALHVPMASGGKTRGVISIGLTEGQKEISGDDVQMIRNLSSQVAVAVETAELKRKEERAYIETVSALAAAVEARDKYTRGHSRRVTEFSVEIARRMGKPGWFVKDLESAALLHDIGKIGIPDTILHNVGQLPPDGMAFILGHPIGGENILKPVGSLARLCPIVRHHHERFDGSGYPDGLKGEEIPIAARVISVADSFDAMISMRAYKPTRDREDAMKELVRCRGSQFDPECVDAFIDYLKEHPETGVLATS
jgi:HD-GYP domain-containing protein (c-di-GMP phosphodiesterase class II)/HAMP domain-containing protein